MELIYSETYSGAEVEVIREPDLLTNQSQLHSCGTMTALLSSHFTAERNPLNPLFSVTEKPKRSFKELQTAASCNRHPEFKANNSLMCAERRWLLCEPSQSVSAWRLAQTTKPRYRACGGALSAGCPCICPCINYTLSCSCTQYKKWMALSCVVQHINRYVLGPTC